MADPNALECLDAASSAGVGLVEFDVQPERPDGSGRLMLARDFASALGRVPITLEEARALPQDRWAGVEIDVDMKIAGDERRVVDALRALRPGAPRLVGAEGAAQRLGNRLMRLPALARVR